jgi:uncharacterized membrane protein
MGAIFQSLGRTIVGGFVVLLLIVGAVGAVTGRLGALEPGWPAFLARWLHVMSGVMWVGLLWYFNFVQIPSMPRIPEEQRPAIARVIAPAALFWFRWAAVATVATGLVLAAMSRYLLDALTFRAGVHAIGVGMWLGLVMAFNVWFIIWPGQKKALGLVQTGPEDKAKAARTVLLTSRLNTSLSIPMLYCMVGQSHGGF